ncbi:MAG: LacI family DNA-binding transcriptional regulator [Paludibacterium sp.]|uniref:LacI family DNA-binding transcriptional regulator n=1 Tax=Paludibacterium sp. TaxID=1917523 RepID=UPI0025FA1F1E|nr:LacI family DNA-binding transcriptional regulator [Paludibacterium sp.]MBV8047494.1 LacI family DNA-binding transcriptional regulator [Paludibacterium sp.]MBV8646375.1 LacI family DNA-binding transcriptional regulator [Paludibacterium sp.]
MAERKPRNSATGRVTLADVARALDISAITVSRALKTPERVSPVLRERITQAVRQLGYRPNHAARALATARSGNVLVLVPSLTNEVFVDVLGGIHDELQPRGMQMLIGNTHYSLREEEKQLEAFLGHAPDGILLSGLDHSPRTQALLAESRLPVVTMMELDNAADSRSVGLSQRAAGQAMTRHLITRGYRRIAYVAAQGDPRTRQRAEGYRAALAEANLDAREIWLETPSSVGLGATLLTELLAQHPDCDAVFCCNDDLAQGMLYECQRRGIAVPARLAIGGFNDLAASAWTHPALTSIATPRYDIGRQAARMLCAAIDNQEAPRALDLGFTLMARGSS